MDAISTQKFIRMAPRKLRLVADMVRGKRVSEVLEFLPFVNRRAVAPVAKVIKTAAANAQVGGVSPADLTIKSIEIGEGPRLKRFRPVSRGQAHGYVKQLSHIKVVLTEEKLKEKVETEPKKGKDES